MTKSSQKRLWSLIISLILIGLGYFLNNQTPPPEVLGTVAPGFYRVTDVADGDTIVVKMGNQNERIRLIGVDTPETQDPRKAVQCYGKAASDFIKQLIGQNPVRLEADQLSSNRDRYDRLLRYVYLPDGRLVQAEIIKSGYGFAYTNFPFTKSEQFKQLETEARQLNQGLWGNCVLTPNEFGGFSVNDI